MKIALSALVLICASVAGAAGYARPDIAAAAAGWSLAASKDGETLIGSPNGKWYNIGETQFPDWVPTGVYLVTVKSLGERFLVLQTPPMASASVPLVIIRIVDGDVPLRLIDIRNRFEWSVGITKEDDVRESLFSDIDGDGLPELVERDISKWGGSVRYFKWRNEKFELVKTEEIKE